MPQGYFRCYVTIAVQPPIAALRRRMSGIRRKCSMLIAIACDPYRPERHYMRGPGPKWFAKHVVVAN